MENISSLTDNTPFTNKDRLWSLLKTDDLELCKIPTWGAFNSLMTNSPVITTCETLPLSPLSPTDWTGIYTALKQVQGINAKISPHRKTIITLDLQLYAKCMELRIRDEIKEHFVFRLGELHIVFAFLKVLGKYISCSGLDQILVEAGVYGPTTLSQILDGKHMKRGFEAHMVLYLSLAKLFSESLSECEDWKTIISGDT